MLPVFFELTLPRTEFAKWRKVTVSFIYPGFLVKHENRVLMSVELLSIQSECRRTAIRRDTGISDRWHSQRVKNIAG